MSKSKPYTYWVFCDESGDLSTKKTRYLIAAAVGTQNPDTLKKAVIRTRKMNRLARGKILHATDLDSKIVTDFLGLIVQVEDLKLSVAVLDKQWIWNQQEGYDALYNQLFAYLIQQAVLAQPNEAAQTLVILERRKKYKSELISDIEKRTCLESSQIQLCAKNDRNWGQQLSVADSIAWSTYQKYEKQDEQFFEIFQDRIELEAVIGVDGLGVMRPVSEMNNSKNERK